jgi:WD40 repeat protein/tRNA A-37 threonylcarbamoyl transferase component Bud32
LPLATEDTIDVRAPSSGAAVDPSRSPTAAASSTTGADALPIVDPSTYEIEGVHGRGGLGRILRARDRRTNRVVAIKEIIHDTPQVIARFQREALVTANLQHPAIVPVYEVGRWPSGKPFYAMKLVVGRSLAQAIEKTAPPEARLALLPHAIQIADAMAYAHGQGWAHRDLKPANILVGDFGETVVIDWGLAGRIDVPDDAPSIDLPASADAHATIAGSVVGTPVYMAPEQARGETIDARADVYAIGAVLYHVLAGVPPYRECRTAADVIARVAVGPPTALDDLVVDVPPDLVAIVERAMHRDLDQRYPTARELAEDLTRFQAGALVLAHDYTTGERIRRFVRQHRGAVAIAAIAAVVLAVVSTLAIRNVIHARDTAQAERTRAIAARADAERESVEASRRLAAQHRELGRAALAAGAPGRALPYLASALRVLPDDHALRVAVGLAVDSVANTRGAIDVGASVHALSIAGDRVLPVTLGDGQSIWNPTTGERSTAPGILGRLSPDGTLVATCSTTLDHAEVRRVGEPAVVANLVPTKGLVFPPGFTDDGRVWLASPDGLVRIYEIGKPPPPEIALPEPLTKPDVHRAGVHGVASTRTGKVLTWRFDTGAVATLPGSLDGEALWLRIAGEADAPIAVLVTRRGTLHAWNLATRAALHTAPLGTDVIVPDLSRDGTRLVVADADSVRVIDPRTGAISADVPAPRTTTVAISRDGASFATGNLSGEMAIWDAATGTPIARAPGHAEEITAIRFTADGTTVVSSSAAGDVRAWRTGTDRLTSLPHADRAWHGDFLDDGSLVTVSADGLGRITTVEGRELAVLRGHQGAVVSMEEGHGWIVTAGVDGTARMWKTSGAALHTMSGHTGKLRTASIAPDGSAIATSGVDGKVLIYDTDGELKVTIKGPFPVTAARWTADSQRLVVTYDAPLAIVWDAAGDKVADIPLMSSTTIDAVMSPKGDRAALWTDGWQLVVISTTDGKVLHRDDHHQGMSSIAWTPDGDLLVARETGRVDRYDASYERRPSLRVASGLMVAMGVHPSNNLLAIGTADGVVHLWDLARDREIATLPVGDPVIHVRWSPSGRRLLVLGLGPIARIWDLSPYDGSPDELDRLVRCRAPARIDGETLVQSLPAPDC